MGYEMEGNNELDEEEEEEEIDEEENLEVNVPLLSFAVVVSPPIVVVRLSLDFLLFVCY